MISSNSVVSMRNLSKRFKKIQALDQIHLDIPTGAIIGLVGANGAGKSTLLRHMIGLYLPDEGQCSTFEMPAAKLGAKELGRIGYVHQEGELLDWMTVKQLIRYVSVYYKNWDHAIEEKYVEDFDISLDDRVGTLSPGQRQKLSILLAIAFGPELLILDEPASALDPIARRQFLNLLLELIQTENRTIIISSHILSDIEKIIDHILIMDRGRLLRDCSFDGLREEFTRFALTSLGEALPETLPFASMVNCQRDSSKAVVTVQNVDFEQIEAAAKEINCHVEMRPMDLEELYQLVVC